MIERNSTMIVPYTPDQMFDLVANVEDYPKFLPWCVALRIVEHKPAPPFEEILSDMVVSYKVFREKFRSRVHLDRGNSTIHAQYENGPFHELKTVWKFTPDDENNTKVDFHIRFEFKNFIMQAAAKQVFEKAFARMNEAFIARADEIYTR